MVSKSNILGFAKQWQRQGQKNLAKFATGQKFFIKDFFCKCDLIRNFLRIWSHLLKKFLMENLIFCAEGC